MKKLLLLALFVSLGSCQEKKETTLQAEATVTEPIDMEKEAARIVDSAANVVDYSADVLENGENPKITKAKHIIDDSTEWVKKGIRNEVSKDEVNKNINALMEDFNAINASLTSYEQDHLEKYRVSKMEEIIDLQMKK